MHNVSNLKLSKKKKNLNIIWDMIPLFPLNDPLFLNISRNFNKDSMYASEGVQTVWQFHTVKKTVGNHEMSR